VCIGVIDAMPTAFHCNDPAMLATWCRLTSTGLDD
jgi:hypothetical protein